MRRHRTTARGILLIAVVGLTAAPAAARLDPGQLPKRAPSSSAEASDKTIGNAPGKRIIFPVLGKFRYTNDFGDPRGQGVHQGIDIMAPRKALAVAAEAGKVKFHISSWRAGCMLYLYGDSGTTYLYVHLNNDLGKTNDNRGTCVPGIAYASGMKNGTRVAAGQPIAFVGDSGDANGIGSHLHFEVHPGNGAAVSPFPYLKRALKLLFYEPEGTNFSLVLDGTVV